MSNVCFENPIELLRKRYYFTDISVMMKMSNGRYINLTDLDLCCDKELIELNCKEKFIFSLSAFGTEVVYAAPVTYDELVELSRTKKVIKSVTSAIKDEETAQQIGAQIAAKKILDNAYGYVEQCDENEELKYDFKRLCRPVNDSTGKRSKVYMSIFSKKFEQVT